ncbi:subtilisin family serine protease [Allocatelliglobosispora scoriae]|uniref:Subtilisin family serine protease n=1 Tax=Allocatelliglobosispora scoriae TaxID=643052 RepID=A0A841BXA1_9ACTN|nr:tectonin domain-containing protein [Allocatelliglobosispora scoriae]MBB5872784.1 subtilisin family serine protease [Allocatelliglobosispora scoriae]
MFTAPRRASTVSGVVAVVAAVLVSSTVTLAASAGPPDPLPAAGRSAVLPLAATTAAPKPGIRGERSSAAIAGSYLVKLKKSKEDLDSRARRLSDTYHGALGQVWKHTAPGFTIALARADAVKLSVDAEVEYVQQDQRLAISPMPAVEGPVGLTQTPAPWALDRIDQHALPLDNNYSFDDSAGQGVSAYILASGIAVSHPDFGGRAVGGGNFVNDGRPSTSDCHGSGTRLAGIVGGTQHGVAKKVGMVSVRISDCSALTSTTAVVNGIDWVIGNAVLPAVIVFPLLDYCVNPQNGQPVPCAPDVAEIIVNAQESTFQAGIAVFGMAGDSGQDTCANATGAAPDTVYVGATTSTDARLGTSNFGPCVTMFAPGGGITTDDPAGTITVSTSGASAAYVAGAAALFAGKPEFEGASPADIRDELVQNRSTPNVVTGLTANTPNRLLFTGPPGFFTVGESASLAPRSDGRLELFGVNRTGSMFHREQAAPSSSTWSSWSQSVSKGWLSVGAEPNGDGRLALLGVTPTGELWLREEMTANSNTFSIWSKLSPPAGAVPLGRVVMAHNLSNRLQIFTTNQQGQVFQRAQLGPGSRLWSAWTPLTFAGKLRSISAVNYADGRIELLGVDDAGQVWRATQLTANDNNWSSFTKIGGFGVASIAAARNANGTLELVAVDAGGSLWHRTQPSVGTWGSTWSTIVPKTLSRVTAETNANGRIGLVGVDNLGNIWQSTQTSANAGTYTSWVQLDGQLRP